MSGPNSTISRCRKTLIAIAIVILLLLFLLFGVYFAVGRSTRNPAYTRTTSTLSGLQNVMTTHLQSNPEPTARDWLAALRSDPHTAQIVAILSTSGGKIVDGWGNPIEYIPAHSPPGNFPTGYFRSAGPDGKFDTVDDFYSLTPGPN